MWSALSSLSPRYAHSCINFDNDFKTRLYDKFFTQFFSSTNIHSDFSCPFNTSYVIDENDIMKALKKMSKLYSCGPDGIHLLFYKIVLPEIRQRIAFVFSKTLQSSFIPDAWKLSYLIPILKKGKKMTDPNSYRPISSSNSLLKIFEKILSNHLIFDLKNKLSVNQHYAIPKKSTVSNLLQFTHLVYEAFELKKKQFLLPFLISPQLLILLFRTFYIKS